VRDTPHVPRISNLVTREKVSLVRGRDTTERRYPLKVFENR
jgi:hypothetical protein